jgi:hypothetical protein
MSNFVGINMPDELVLKSFAAFKETLLRLANINISILFMHLYRFYLIHGIKWSFLGLVWFKTSIYRRLQLCALSDIFIVHVESPNLKNLKPHIYPAYLPVRDLSIFGKGAQATRNDRGFLKQAYRI